MTASRFIGRVILVAGLDSRLDQIAADLVGRGAFVAFVAKDHKLAEAHASFLADPTDPAVWDRVVPHVEQRLGPIDAVVCDPATRPLAAASTAADLARRGHGAVVTVEADTDADKVVSALAGTL